MKDNKQNLLIIIIIMLVCVVAIPLAKLIFFGKQSVYQVSHDAFCELGFDGVEALVNTNPQKSDDQPYIVIGENVCEDEQQVVETSAQNYIIEHKEGNSFFVNLSIVSSILIFAGAIYISIKLVMA